MPGDHVHRIRVSLETFQGFRDDRPKEEKWELIDGTPTMMPPPALVHQRIARNLQTLLNARLQQVRPDWMADIEIGVLLPDEESYNPEPDVTVIDTDVELGQVYAERFYFVAEVLSPNDKQWVLDLKRSYYQAHAHCRGFIFVRQDRIEAELNLRKGATWISQQLHLPTDRMEISDIGDIGALRELYLHTPLWRAQPESDVT
jgi:Uma2 family endonuclease